MLPPSDDPFVPRKRDPWGAPNRGRPRPSPGSHLGRKRCVVCERPLTVHQEVSGGTCAGRYCRQQEIIRRSREARERAEREQLERARRHLASIVADPATRVPPDAALVVLPANPAGISRLPDERRAAILEHIRERAAEAIEARRDPAAAGPDPLDRFAVFEVRDEHRATLAAACATCRGRCCLSGKEHAYVTRATMKRFFEGHPEADVAEAAEQYARHLPESSYENGCVFQGPAGCTLPRTLRSDTCNSFLCGPLRTLNSRLKTEAVESVFACAMVETDLRFSAWIDHGAIREPRIRTESDQTPTK